MLQQSLLAPIPCKEVAKPLLSHFAVALYSFTVLLHRATHHLEDAEVSGRGPSKGCELKIIGVVNFTSLSIELSFRPSTKWCSRELPGQWKAGSHLRMIKVNCIFYVTHLQSYVSHFQYDQSEWITSIKYKYSETKAFQYLGIRSVHVVLVCIMSDCSFKMWHNSFPQSVKWLFVSSAHLVLGLAAGDSALILFHLAHLHGSHCLLQWLNLDCLHTTLGTLW